MVWYGMVLVWYGFGQMALWESIGGGISSPSPPLPFPFLTRPGQANQLTGYSRGSWERSQNPVLSIDPSALARRSFSTFFFFSFYFFTFLLFYDIISILKILKVWRFWEWIILGFLIYTIVIFFSPILSLLFSPFHPPPFPYRFLQSVLGCCQYGNAFWALCE